MVFSQKKSTWRIDIGHYDVGLNAIHGCNCVWWCVCIYAKSLDGDLQAPYLHELDWYVKHTLKCKQYLRYADDVIIVSHDKHELERPYEELELFLKQNLNLTTHKKVVRSMYSGIDVFGLVFSSKYERLRRSTERRKRRREEFNSN